MKFEVETRLLWWKTRANADVRKLKEMVRKNPSTIWNIALSSEEKRQTPFFQESQSISILNVIIGWIICQIIKLSTKPIFAVEYYLELDGETFKFDIFGSMIAFPYTCKSRQALLDLFWQ